MLLQVFLCHNDFTLETGCWCRCLSLKLCVCVLMSVQVLFRRFWNCVGDSELFQVLLDL